MNSSPSTWNFNAHRRIRGARWRWTATLLKENRIPNSRHSSKKFQIHWERAEEDFFFLKQNAVQGRAKEQHTVYHVVLPAAFTGGISETKPDRNATPEFSEAEGSNAASSSVFASRAEARFPFLSYIFIPFFSPTITTIISIQEDYRIGEGIYAYSTMHRYFSD